MHLRPSSRCTQEKNAVSVLNACVVVAVFSLRSLHFWSFHGQKECCDQPFTLRLHYLLGSTIDLNAMISFATELTPWDLCSSVSKPKGNIIPQNRYGRSWQRASYKLDCKQSQAIESIKKVNILHRSICLPKRRAV